MRSPLFCILGYIQLLYQHLENSGPNKVTEYLNCAREAALRLDQMVTEMLDLARFGQGPTPLKMEAISVGELFHRLWNTFQGIAKVKGINLRLIIKEDENLTLWGDFKLLERALDNLIGNAIKFSRPEREVTVTASRREGRIVFEIQDYGRGIPREFQAKIFEPFAQIQDSDRAMGFGLGLPIVKFIARAHQGDVQVHSESGQGSCFTFWVPENLESQS